jgi:hypothetical protein
MVYNNYYFLLSIILIIYVHYEIQKIYLPTYHNFYLYQIIISLSIPYTHLQSYSSFYSSINHHRNYELYRSHPLPQTTPLNTNSEAAHHNPPANS